MTDAREHLWDALQWALDTSVNAAAASADWLAMDIDPRHSTAESLLTDSGVGLLSIRRAKDAYKTMRIVGETSADRRLGARLYAAAIAAGLAWHGRRISEQSDSALRRAFTGLHDDTSMPKSLRDLAGRALNLLPEAPPFSDDPESLPMPPGEAAEDGDVPLA
jgi:hypothetical protein